MLLDSAETLFLTAKNRVYGAPEKQKGAKKPKIDGDKNKVEEKEEKMFDFDVNPKWLALSEILSDIKKELEDNKVIY